MSLKKVAVNSLGILGGIVAFLLLIAGYIEALAHFGGL